MDAVANPTAQLQEMPSIVRASTDPDAIRELKKSLSRKTGTSRAGGVEKQSSFHYEREMHLCHPEAGGPEEPKDEMDVEKAVAYLAPEDAFPEGGLRAWLVVASSWMLLFPSFGFMVSIGTLQDYWNQNQLSFYSARDIGWIPSVFVYLSLALGIWVGPLFDRYGPRWIALLGSVAFVSMIFLLAECTKYWHFMLCVGLLGGLGGAMLTTTSLAVVAHWFKVRRGLAQGIAMMGSSCGGLTIPLILRSSLPKFGYAWSLRIIGFMFLVCFITGNILIKARIPQSADNKKKAMISLTIFGDQRFTFFTMAVFGFEVVLFGALGILPTYATLTTNFSPETGFYLIAILNGVSCLGRILPGYVADKIGRFNTLLIMIVFTLIFMLVLWLPWGHKSLPALYVFAALFGFGTGSWMALTPACLGQLCRAEEFGRYYGSMYFIASLATLVCIPISGQLVEVVGPQPLVGFYCAVLGLSLISFVFSRWACLGKRWVVKEKI